MTVTQLVEIAAQPQLHVHAKHGGRKAKLRRSATSFRPGQIAVSSIEDRKLLVCIPASNAIGTDEEGAAVRTLVKVFVEFNEVGTVSSYGLKNGDWEITLTLKSVVQGDDDQLLSNAFLKLQTAIENSEILQDGFVPTKPTWKFLIGDFVADEGGFV